MMQGSLMFKTMGGLLVSASNAGRVAVIGASGSGKSSYVKQLLKAHRRVVIFDPMDEYKREGAARVRSVEEARQIMRDSFGRFALAYVPPAGGEARALNRLSHLCIAAQAPWKGKPKGPELCMVVEEMNSSFPVHGAEGKAPAFAEICSRGRHSHIHVIGVTQRFAEVSTRFRGNLTECVVFRQQGPNDIRAAIDATGASRDQITALKNLQYLRSVAGEIETGEL